VVVLAELYEAGGVMTRLAVMEEDTVLCAECVDELHAEGVGETAATIVHAWLSKPAGQICACCATADDGERGS
jgi:hypothetical protein